MILPILLTIVASFSIENLHACVCKQLILDQKKLTTDMPIHFRKASDPFPTREHEGLPSREGLDHLRASGSSQFSQNGFYALLKRLAPRNKLYIVDLRQESHGFLNKLAVSWYVKHNLANKGKSLDEIDRDEDKRLRRAKADKNVTIEMGVHLGKRSDKLCVKHALTEGKLARKHNVRYKRIPVMDNSRPSNKQIDRFVSFVKTLPKDSWLHFHCEAGIGRTTTFMAMYDMMKNAKQVSLEDIIARQMLLGGMNLLKPPRKAKWDYDYVVARRSMIKRFYQYCRHQAPRFRQSWSTWIKKNR